MAKPKGVSNATVHRLWRANDIKPRLTRTFKLSNDKDFEPKFRDVIGLYLNPPDKASQSEIVKQKAVAEVTESIGVGIRSILADAFGLTYLGVKPSCSGSRRSFDDGKGHPPAT